jgi:two-component system phosphate regulon response regulator PhoB
MPGNPMLKISLIEDDPNMASLLSMLLEMEGYTVRLAGNHHVHGLLQAIIDVNLAKGSGLDLVRSIRREPEIKSTCILMTSGLYLEKESLQAGADGFIQKPFMPDELLKLIQDTYQQSTTYQLEKE